jgi:hypothetical protein
MQIPAPDNSVRQRDSNTGRLIPPPPPEPPTPEIPLYPPWSPSTLVVVSVLGGFAAAGILAGINWKRLGRPERWLSTCIFSVIAFIISEWLFWFNYLTILFLELAPISIRKEFVIGAGVNLAVGALIALWQRDAYRAWVKTHGKPLIWQSGWVAPILAIAGVAVLQACLVPAIEDRLPAQTFSGDGIKLTYPGSWHKIHIDDEAVCGMYGTECISTFRHRTGGVAIEIIRTNNPWLTLMEVEDLGRLWRSQSEVFDDYGVEQDLQRDT